MWCLHGVGKGMLQMELTKDNMELLLKKPPGAESVPWHPRIEEPDVVWQPLRSRVACKWWDSTERKYKEMSKYVKLEQGDSEEKMQEAVNVAAADLQALLEYYRPIEYDPDYPYEHPDDCAAAELGRLTGPKRLMGITAG